MVDEEETGFGLRKRNGILSAMPRPRDMLNSAGMLANGNGGEKRGLIGLGILPTPPIVKTPILSARPFFSRKKPEEPEAETDG